jgi:hemoglobin
MMKKLIVAGALLGLAALPAVADHDDHSFDGKSYTVQLTEKRGGQATDRLTFSGGKLESEWLRGLGFDAAAYEADDGDEFHADFVKGEETVRYEGEIERGALSGEVEWSRDREGGKRRWDYVAAAAGARSLYERLGGTPALTAVTSTFVDVIVQDPVMLQNPQIAADFKKADVARLKGKLTEFMVVATGGPGTYTGRDNKSVHVNMKIGEREWDAMVQDFLGVLAQFKVPEREQQELVALVATTKPDIVTVP